MELTYLGSNTLMLKKEKSALLIDPHFTRPGLLRLVFGLEPDTLRVSRGLRLMGVESVDAVLLTHTHYDHALDLSAVIRLTGGTVYGSESARQILLGAGLPKALFHLAQPSEISQVGAFSLRFHSARHIPFPPPLRWLLPESGVIEEPLRPPAPFWAYHCGEVYAIQVDRTLVFGSAGFKPGACAGLDLEAVVLGIGGLEIKPDSYLQQLYHETVVATGARFVWLSHWDNFLRPLDRKVKHLAFSNRTFQRIKALGEEHGQMVAQLPFNQPVHIF